MPFGLEFLVLAAVPHLVAARAPSPPSLDGRLDDPAWRAATPSDAFTQKAPVDGKAPGDRTTVRVLYDDDYVYIGIDCTQSVEVTARLTRRDRQVEADTVSVAFDTRGDGTSAFEFAVNAGGVLSDTLHFNDTDTNPDWDENWEAMAARTATGWTAELRIPLRALRFAALPVQSWGLQVRRYVSARQELDEWAYIPRDAAGEVSHYGRLDNLVGLRPQAPIELRPFVVGTVRHHDPLGTTLARGYEPALSGGLDLKWHVNQALTLDATVLPDFGQVEADQVIFNLTTYEIYYPEKRPFFLEGVDTFATPLQLLYTRRIGRAPDVPTLQTTAAGTELLASNPVPSLIYGATKLVGELGDRWTFGELTAVTGRQTVDVQLPGGLRVSRAVDPFTTYKVLRLKRAFGDNGSLGFLATATNRLESPGDYPLVAGASPATGLCPSGVNVAPGARCTHDAYAGGVDGRWRSPSGDYTVTGQAIATLIADGAPRTLLDGTVVKAGDAGPAVSLKAAKEGGKSFTGLVEYEGYGRRVDYNDLGFMLRQNLHKGHAGLEYRRLEPNGPTLETHTFVDYYERDNLDGLNQYRALQLGTYVKFKNFWGLYANVHYQPPHFDDREVGDGAALERGGLAGADVWAGTDSRKRVYAQLWTEVNAVTNGVGFSGDGQLSFKLLPQWDVDLLPNWVFAAGEPRYFATQAGSYLFGRQRAQSLSLTLRSTYTFTPRLTLQAYMQAILESEHFSDYTASPAAGAGTVIRLFALRAAPFAPAANPDFESGTINASVLLRWEYTLGSTAFLVYTHAQNDTLTPSFGDGAGYNFAVVKPRAAEDAVLLKLSYWWR